MAIVLSVVAPPEIIPVTEPKSAAKLSAEDLKATLEGPVLERSQVNTNSVTSNPNKASGVTTNCM